MNQILQTSLVSENKRKMRKRILIVQFCISLALFFTCGFYYGLLSYKRYQQENYSNSILKSYNITKIYADYKTNSVNNINNKIDESSNNLNVIGIIKIPSIDIEYPIFANCNEELLKISPCRFYGSLPGKVGNLCVAGHNYNNKQFFSQIGTLDINDIIYVYDSFNKCFEYKVFDNYEVKSDNLLPVYSNSKKLKELTLITCNNFNQNRIIIKAKITT